MSAASPRVFSTEFKVDLVRRLERGEAAAKVAREAEGNQGARLESNADSGVAPKTLKSPARRQIRTAAI
jgi:transposase-like protein